MTVEVLSTVTRGSQRLDGFADDIKLRWGGDWDRSKEGGREGKDKISAQGGFVVGDMEDVRKE